MTGSGGLHELDDARVLGHMARRRAEWLLLGRLVLTAVSFAIAVGIEEGPGGELSEGARVGLFWTVALAFGATAISATLVRQVRHLHRFAGVQITLDVVIVTALVHFSGGHESVFAFLYVLVTVYGALLFERWGAFSAASVSAFCYAAVLLAGNGYGPPWAASAGGVGLPLAALAAVWGVHVGALFLVGALASVLSRELRRTGQALDRRTDALIRLRNLHERTVESIMSGLLTTDRNGNLTSFNPEAERILGMRALEVLGRRLDDVIPGASEQVLAPGSRSEAPERSRSRMRLRNQSGRELHIGLAGSILWNEDGDEAGHVLIFQDVTDVVAMEAQLRRSERLAAVGELSAKMAHEIRNPLAAISGAIQVLHRGMRPEEIDHERERLMDIVVREADRLSGLIRDFLDYARPRPPRQEPVELAPLVADVVKLFESSLPPKVTIVTDLRPGVCVVADPSQLEQVLWNLFLNAVQAMPDGGELRVAVDAPADPAPQAKSSGRRNGQGGDARSGTRASRWAEIVVADTGVGIPLEVQDEIFEPFFTTKKRGSGLGLSTVHRIVETHGGMLQVESVQGQGTTFRIDLPRMGAVS
jgi:two-component system sensor histidine kinase PilS (NtrC family)